MTPIAAPSVALCRVAWSDRNRYWAVTIACCPYCGKRHFHGAGDGPEPDLGWRAAHCDRPIYELVETPASIAARGDTPGPALPYGCLDCAAIVGRQRYRCSGCES